MAVTCWQIQRISLDINTVDCEGSEGSKIIPHLSKKEFVDSESNMRIFEEAFEKIFFNKL